MTISFSGPSSGIDTNAWVEALVKMKQASVDSLEAKKETLVATTSILENVKSFFSSFKSVINTVTQSNMGIASFDLFVQNLVESTNADVVTASVTTEAQQANYEVYVDQVATETEAQSSFLTDIISTTEAVASHNSLLSSIGIGTGNVGFNVGGVERVITLQSNDTIGSFLEKLNKIGIDASYDANLGVFAIDVGVEDINDDIDGDGINNTGIKEALFLTNVNSGYSSNVLELSELTSFLVNATADAKMSVFGVTEGTYTITTVLEDGTKQEVGIFEADIEGSFNDFFEAIKEYGLYASFDEEGVIHIETTNGCLISGALAEQLGIVTDDQSIKTDTRAASTVGAFSTEVMSAEYTSTLGELGAIVDDTDTLKIYDVHNNLIDEITTLTRNSTVDDLFYVLAEYSIAGSLNNNVISFDSPLGNIIGGKIAENMGIETFQTSTTTIKTGNSTTSTAMISYVASATDWVSDCLWDVWDSYSDADKILTVTHRDRDKTEDGNINIQTYTYTVVAKNSIAADGSVLRGTQFQDIADWYHSIDPTSTFVFNDNGQIFIDSNDTFYFEGKIAEYLGIGGYSVTYTWTEGITTTSSSETVSYRVRKTDYISDTLWDNGWLEYSADDKVIKAYSLTVDHTAGINSVNNPTYTDTGAESHSEYVTDGSHAEGNYVETSSTYQHTIQTLVGTFTIKEGQTTYEDLGYWFTHIIDQTAAFTINNDGTISIDSNNTFHLEGKAITDLGLGISSINQSWTTGLEETVSTNSVTYAVKMTDYISDTYTDTAWAKANKKLSVYSNTVDHYAGSDGNGVYQVTIQTKLTDIYIDEQTTFNDLRDALAPYDIHLSISDKGVITFDSSAANYLVEEAFCNITIKNGVTVVTSRTSSSDGSTSMINHFGIKYDTIHQSWTTGTATTESTGVVNYVIKLTDYMSDTFTATEWANLASYTDSAGNSHNGKQIAVMHSYIDHTNHRTIIETKTVINITTETTFQNLKDILANLDGSDSRNNILMNINDGVLTLDSNCCWIEGSIPNHYGVKTDSVTMNWTTGTASTESTAIVNYNACMTDYISDTFTASEWAALSNYTDTSGKTNGGKQIAVMHAEIDHANQRTIITRATQINIDTNTTFNDLAASLATYGISLTIQNGVVKLDSNAVSGLNNSNYYIEGRIPDHWGVMYDSITSNWTTGTASTESTGIVNYNVKMTDYISDTYTASEWNSVNKVLTIKHTYLDHNTQKTVIEDKTTFTMTNQTTFNDLAAMLAPWGMTLGISNGVVTIDSDPVSNKNREAYYVTGAVANHYGINQSTITQTWTYGTDTTGAASSFVAKMTDYISDSFTLSDWNSVGKTITIKHTYLDHNSQTVKIEDKGTITVTDQMTFQQLADKLAEWGMPLSITSGGVVTIDSNIVNSKNHEAFYITGGIPDHWGIRTDQITQTWTYGTDTTGAASSFVAKMTDYISDTFTASAWASLNKTLTIKHNYLDHNTQSVKVEDRGTITLTDQMTFNDLASMLADWGMTLSITSGGVVTIDSDPTAGTNNRESFYVTGAAADHWGINQSTMTQTWTYGTDSNGSASSFLVKATDYVADTFTSSAWSSANKTITVYHNELNHTSHKVDTSVKGTMTANDSTTIQNVIDWLATQGITMKIENGVITTDSAATDYVTGDIPAHWGIGTTEITQNWTTGTEETIGAPVSYKIRETDLIQDLFANWGSVNKTITIKSSTLDHSSHNTVITTKTFNVGDSTTWGDLKSTLASYSITMSLTDGVISLNSDRVWAEGEIMTAVGATSNSLNQSWTYGTETTSRYLIFNADSNTLVQDIDITESFNSSHLSGGSAEVYRMTYDYESHSVVEKTVGSISWGAEDSISSIASQLSAYGISMSISNGNITITSDRQGNYIKKKSFFNCNRTGVDSTTLYYGANEYAYNTVQMTHTFGTTATSSAGLTYSGVLMSDKISDTVGIGSNTALYVVKQEFDYNTRALKLTTVATASTSGTWSDLSSSLSSYGMSISASGDKLTLSQTNGDYYVAGSLSTFLEWGPKGTQITETVGQSYTGSALTATAQSFSKLSDYGVSSGTLYFKKWNAASNSATTVSSTYISNSSTFNDLINAVQSCGGTASMSGGKISANSGVNGCFFEYSPMGWSQSNSSFGSVSQSYNTHAFLAGTYYWTTYNTVVSSSTSSYWTNIENITVYKSEADWEPDNNWYCYQKNGTYGYLQAIFKSNGCPDGGNTAGGFYYTYNNNSSYKHSYTYYSDHVTLSFSYYQSTTTYTTNVTSQTNSLRVGQTNCRLDQLAEWTGNTTYSFVKYTDDGNGGLNKQTASVTLYGSDYVSDAINKLSAYVGVSNQGSYYYFSGGSGIGEWLITGCSSSGIGSAGGSGSLSRSTLTGKTSYSSSKYTRTADASTDYAELGYVPGHAFANVYTNRSHTGGSNPVYTDATCESGETIGDFISELNSYGLSASISGGRITISSSGANCLHSIYDSKLFTTLGLSGSASSYQKTTNWTKTTNSGTSKALTTNVTANNYSVATLANMGVSSGQSITFICHKDDQYCHDVTTPNGKSITGVNETIKLNFTTGTTLKGVVDAINASKAATTYGFSASFADGKITLKGTNKAYISDIGSGLAGAIKTSGYTGTAQYTLNCEAKSNVTALKERFSKSRAKLSDLGLSNQTFTFVVHTDPNYTSTNQNSATPVHTITVTWSAGQSFKEFSDSVKNSSLYTYFQQAGSLNGDTVINFAVSGAGLIAVQGSEYAYLAGVSSGLAGLGLGAAYSSYNYSINYRANADNNAEYNKLQEHTTLQNLGLSAQSVTIVKHTNNTYVAANTSIHGATNCTTTVTVNWTTGENFGSFLNKLRAEGLTASVDKATGVWKFAGNENIYVSSVSDGLKGKTSLTTKEGGTYGRSYGYTLKYRSSADSIADYCLVNERNTKLGNMGLSSESLTFVLHTNQTYVADCTKAKNCTKTVTINWTSSETLQQFEDKVNSTLASQFSSVGAPNGFGGDYKVTFGVDKNSGKWSIKTGENLYLSGVSNGLQSKLGISPTSKSYNYTINYRANADTNADYTYLNERNSMLHNLSLSGESLTFVLHTNQTYVADMTKATHCTETVTINWTSGETLKEFQDKVNSTLRDRFASVGAPNGFSGNYGVTFGVDKNTGKWSIKTGENLYLSGISSGLQSKLGITPNCKVYAYTINYRANADDKADFTIVNQRNTKLGNMGLSSESLTFVLHTNQTYVADMTKATNCTKTVTINWTSGETLQQFEDKVNSTLASQFSSVGSPNGFSGSYGVTFDVDKNTGKWSIKTGENLYLSDISNGLRTKLGITPNHKTYNYTINYRANADNTVEKTYLNERNTKLHNMSITSNQTMTFVVHTHNTYVTDNTKATNVTKTVTVTWTTNETLQQFEDKVNSTLASTYASVGAPNNVYGNYSIQFSVDPQTGKWKFTGNESTYVKDVSSELASFMKINKKEGGTYGQSYKYTINYRADADGTVDHTYVNERNTKLFNISIGTAQTMDIVLHTNNTFAVNNTDASSVSKISNVTKTITVTWTTSQTLGDFEAAVRAKLASETDQDGRHIYDMTFSVNPENGKWKFTGNEYCYVNRIDSALENYMKLTGDKKQNGTYGKSFQYTINYRADADNSKDYTYLNERNTKLHNMSISSNQTMTFVVHTNNTFAQDSTDGMNSVSGVTRTTTVTWTTGETLGEFENKVNAHLANFYNQVGTTTHADGTYHIQFGVNPENGKLSMLGTEYVYLYDVSDPLENFLKLTGDKKENGTYGTSYDYNIIYRADADSLAANGSAAIDYTYLNERNTTLNNLSYVNSSGQTISTNQSQTIDIVIHINNTYAQDNTKSGIEQGDRSSNRTIYTTTTSGVTQTSSSAVTYNQSVVASSNSTFAQLNIDTSQAVSVYGADGVKRGEFTLNSTDTLSDFFTAVNNLNSEARARISNGTIYISNGYVSGNVATALGLNRVDYGTTTIANIQTSASSVTYDAMTNADASTTLATLGFNTSDKIEVFDSHGEKLGEFTLSNNATLGDYVSSINAINTEAEAELKNGVISIKSGYVSGTLANSLGMTAQTTSQQIKRGLTVTSSSSATFATYENADGDTTFGSLGIDTTDEVTVHDMFGNIINTIQLTQTSTINDLVSAINALYSDANAAYNGNTISIQKGYISGDVATALGFKITNAKYTYKHGTTSASTAVIKDKSGNSVTSETTVSQLFGSYTSGKYEIALYNAELNQNVTITVTRSQTNDMSMGDIMSSINAASSGGITCTLNDGIMTITGSDSYLISVNTTLNNKLHIPAGSGKSYVEETVSIYNSTTTTKLQETITHTLNEDTTFADMGITNGYIYVNDKSAGNNGSLSIYSNRNNKIIETLRDQLNLTVSLDAYGRITIDGDNENYIVSMPNDFANALNIEVGENNSWINDTEYIYTSTKSNKLSALGSATLTTSTTLGDLGLTNESFVMGNGSTYHLASNNNVVSALKNAGLSVSVTADGKISIVGSGNTYIKSMSEGLRDALNIGAGEGFTYIISNETSYGSTNSNKLYATLNRSITSQTTMSNLGLSNATITTNTGTITLNSNDNIVTKLKSAGLGVSIVEGKINISGNSEHYITGMSDNLRSALKINVGENETWKRFVDETVVSGNISAVTRTITVTWTYGALGTEDNQPKPETLSEFLNDINVSLAQATTTYKEMFNLSEDFTLSAYVDGNGKFHFTGDEYTYVSNVSDFLGKALKINTKTKENSTYGRSYQYNVKYANNSNNQTQYTYVNYDNMRLQNFDVYEDQYITIITNNNTTFSADTTKNGTVLFDNTSSTYVITWTVGSTGHTLQNGGYNNNNNAITDGETFEQLKYELEHYGVLNALATEASAALGSDIYKINVTINADKTISLVGNEYTYISGISPDLQRIFKIENREGEGYYYSTYDYDIYFNNDGYTKQNTTLLNYDTRLDNLSIMADMTMTIETPEGGKSITIDHDTSIQELKERLFSDYGIDITIEDKTGRLTFTPTLANEGYYILGMDTELKNGFKIFTGENGVYTFESEQIIATNQAGIYTTTVHQNVTSTLGTYETSTIDNYDNSATRNLRYEDDNNIIKMDTRISRINGYDNGNGNIIVHYADGLEQNISIRDSMTMGQLCGIFQDYGVTAEILAGGRVTFKSNDGTYIKRAEGGSNLLDVLNVSAVSTKIEGTTVITSKTLNRMVEEERKYFASEDTKLSEFADGLLLANGIITFSLNDKYKSVTITSDDTFGTLISKFKEKGLNAKIESGKFSISSGYDTFSIIQDGTTSNLSAIINLNERVDLGGFAMTDRSKTIISTTTITDTKSLSVANYADETTQLGTFNIIGGTLSLYIDGKKAGIQVSENDTIRTLQNKFRTALGQDINGSDDENLNVKFEDGYLKIYQKGVNVIVGSNEDTSNFAAITGTFSNSGAVESTRCFYKANENTKLTEAGVFRNGNVTVGDFVVGNATITIDETTTIGQLAAQINTNPDSNVTAYWDSINGEFRIKSNSTGDFYINFEAGSSNVTDILGFTKTSYDAETDKTTTSINTATQKHGKNARVTINGASYTSVSNTMGSDVTGIKGMTINLKGMSAGEATILSVKRDVQSLALAISDVVDAYNALIDNINVALSSKSELSNDTELKRLRNQIKSIMTGTNKNSSIFKNIVAIGIVTDTADPTNLSVGSGIYKLTLDYEKFAKAFEADSESVRTLLIGRVDSEGNVIEEGILNKLEALIDETVEAAGGYFERTENSFDRQIDRIDNKIVKGNAAIEKYRERLEKKYLSMNILNSNIQTQYQVYFK